MSKKEKHTVEPSKLTRFQSFEEMKSAPISFPSKEPLAQLQNEYKKVIAQLRSTFSAGKDRWLKK